MILTVDIGNSNIVIGGYNSGEQLRFSSRVTTDRTLEADQYAVKLQEICHLYGISPVEVDGMILASVVPPLTGAVAQALRHIFGREPMLFSRHLNTGVTVDIDNPDELGADILASAVAVCQKDPLPAVIVDMGTATTITALTADKRVCGVAIAPGLYISLNALTGSASQLQGIAIEPPDHAIGRNTADSMKSGCVLGSAAMLDGMIQRFQEELGEVETIVATGGVAGIVVPHCRTPIDCRPDLLLEGLYEAYLLNLSLIHISEPGR